MDTKQYTRKPFPVNAVQVTLTNVDEVAQWCRGIVQMESTKMLGTHTDLPVIKIQGQGDNRGKVFTASLGCFVVEQKGSYRVYKPAQFLATFDEIVPEEDVNDRHLTQPDLWSENGDPIPAVQAIDEFEENVNHTA